MGWEKISKYINKKNFIFVFGFWAIIKCFIIMEEGITDVGVFILGKRCICMGVCRGEVRDR